LKKASLVFFYGYVLTLILAGAWGIFGARLDMSVLLRVHIHDVSHRAAANLLSQYRFLRGIELGFGLFALVYRHQIYTLRSFNRLFLFTMGCGILGRLVSLPLDGSPSIWMYFFAAFEATGIVLIYAATRRTLVD
jgi:hypothetical protein